MNTSTDTLAADVITPDEEAYTTWTDDDAQAFNDVLMHPALAEGPMPELLEGFITGTAISPFQGLAEDLLAPLFEVYEMDFAMLDEAARAPLIAMTQKRMDAILDGLDQEISAAENNTPLPEGGFFVPLLTDWDATAKGMSDDAATPEGSDTSETPEAPTDDLPPVLPKMAELWARGMLLAYAMWQDNQWSLLDKRLRKALPKLHAPIERLCAEGKNAVSETRTRLKLFDDCMVSVYELYTMSQQFYQRLAVTPAPMTKADVPGRNDPCSCGSGKKYKKCCGA